MQIYTKKFHILIILASSASASSDLKALYKSIIIIIIIIITYADISKDTTVKFVARGLTWDQARL